MKFWASFWKYVRATFISESMKQYIVDLVLKLVVNSTGGIQFAIAKFLVKKVVEWGWASAKYFVINKETKAVNKIIEDNYDKVVKNPEAKPEDIRKSFDDLIGGDFK